MKPETFKTCVYFSNWSVYERKHFPTDLPTSKITNIFYAFLAIDESNGSVKLSDEWCDTQLPLISPKSQEKSLTGNLQQLFELKQLHRNLKVSMSIGGWGAHKAFKNVLSSHKKMDKFVKTSLEFLQKYGFDGIDIDWEYPETKKEGALLVQVLQKLKEEMNQISPSLLLTVATPGSEENLKVLNFRMIDQYVSFWNVMCYDFCGESWSSKTGFHSNLFGNNGDNDLNGSQIIEYYLGQGIHPKKLIMGMPMYGRKFHGVEKPLIGQKFKKEAKKSSEDNDIIEYKELNDNNDAKWEHGFDAKKVSAFAYNHKNKQFAVYDNVASTKIKAQYVKSKHLGGGMWWDSAGDTKEPSTSLLHTFVDQLGGEDDLEKCANHLDIYKDSSYLQHLY